MENQTIEKRIQSYKEAQKDLNIPGIGKREQSFQAMANQEKNIPSIQKRIQSYEEAGKMIPGNKKLETVDPQVSGSGKIKKYIIPALVVAGVILILWFAFRKKAKK